MGIAHIACGIAYTNTGTYRQDLRNRPTNEINFFGLVESRAYVLEVEPP